MSRLYAIPFSSDLVGTLSRLIIEGVSDPGRTAVIFPGKRPALYLKSRLSKDRGDLSFFPPLTCSLDEFNDRLARMGRPSFTDLDRADAVWLLFSLIRSLPAFDGHPFRKKEFGEFFHWGRHLIDFIDRVDAEGIDDSRLSGVEKNAAIGYDVPASINELLTKISILRREFHRLLYEREWFTKGTKSMAAVEYIRGGGPIDLESVFFAGIFGLSGNEREIIKYFWDAGNTTIVLEGDPDEWPILKEITAFLKAPVEPVVAEVQETRTVSLHAGNDSHMEVLAAYRIISEGARQKTALVLPDAGPLFSLLNFVVDRTPMRCNISMGYPVSRTGLFDLVSHILKARMRKRPGGHYPAGEYLAVVLHPFIKNLAPVSGLREILRYIERSLTGEIPSSSITGKQLVTLGEIENEAVSWTAPTGKGSADEARLALADVHRTFFSHFDDIRTIGEVAKRLEEALEAILLGTPVRSYVLSGTIFKSIFESLGSLRSALFNDAVMSEDPEENIRSLCDLTLRYLGGARLPFDTHPIEELEVIGLLEARSLSFDRLIILDVNEGVLPGPREINPLVPLGVFETLGIPSSGFTEEIYRYNFYRLIGSAKEVHLIYRSNEDRPRSRYIEEIIWQEEKKQKIPGVLPVSQVSLPVNLHRENKPPVIEKTVAVIEAIKNRGLSPSAVDSYVRCPLLYYFTRLIGLEERRPFSGDIEATDRGGAVHKILRDTFLPFLGKPLTKDMSALLRESLEKATNIHFGGQTLTGDYYLFEQVASFKLGSFLRRHLEGLDEPLVITHLEEGFSAGLQIGDTEVRLSGRIDRVDYHPSTERYTVIDYKTGTTKQYPPKIFRYTSFDDIASIHDHVTSFQLPIYMHIFTRGRDDVQSAFVDAKLILLGSNEEESFFKGKDASEDERCIEGYMKGLQTVISHMLDPDIPFTPFDTRHCADCSARPLCHM